MNTMGVLYDENREYKEGNYTKNRKAERKEKLHTFKKRKKKIVLTFCKSKTNLLMKLSVEIQIRKVIVREINAIFRITWRMQWR